MIRSIIALLGLLFSQSVLPASSFQQDVCAQYYDEVKDRINSAVGEWNAMHLSRDPSIRFSYEDKEHAGNEVIRLTKGDLEKLLEYSYGVTGSTPECHDLRIKAMTTVDILVYRYAQKAKQNEIDFRNRSSPIPRVAPVHF